MTDIEQLGFCMWYYAEDGVTPRAREARLAFLNVGIAQRKSMLGEDTSVTAEQLDALFLRMWEQAQHQVGTDAAN
jgi:hypothetical protein